MLNYLLLHILVCLFNCSKDTVPPTSCVYLFTPLLAQDHTRTFCISPLSWLSGPLAQVCYLVPLIPCLFRTLIILVFTLPYWTQWRLEIGEITEKACPDVEPQPVPVWCVTAWEWLLWTPTVYNGEISSEAFETQSSLTDCLEVSSDQCWQQAEE